MSAALKPSADKPVAIWSFEAITCATAGTDSQRPRRMPRDARTCMSDSIARSLATAMDRPSGSKLACATQLAICASARGARVRGRRPLFSCAPLRCCSQLCHRALGSAAYSDHLQFIVMWRQRRAASQLLPGCAAHADAHARGSDSSSGSRTRTAALDTAQAL